MSGATAAAAPPWFGSAAGPHINIDTAWKYLAKAIAKAIDKGAGPRGNAMEPSTPAKRPGGRATSAAKRSRPASPAVILDSDLYGHSDDDTWELCFPSFIERSTVRDVQKLASALRLFQSDSSLDLDDPDMDVIRPAAAALRSPWVTVEHVRLVFETIRRERARAFTVETFFRFIGVLVLAGRPFPEVLEYALDEARRIRGTDPGQGKTFTKELGDVVTLGIVHGSIWAVEALLGGEGLDLMTTDVLRAFMYASEVGFGDSDSGVVAGGRVLTPLGSSGSAWAAWTEDGPGAGARLACFRAVSTKVADALLSGLAGRAAACMVVALFKGHVSSTSTERMEILQKTLPGIPLVPQPGAATKLPVLPAGVRVLLNRARTQAPLRTAMCAALDRSVSERAQALLGMKRAVPAVRCACMLRDLVTVHDDDWVRSAAGALLSLLTAMTDPALLDKALVVATAHLRHAAYIAFRDGSAEAATDCSRNLMRVITLIQGSGVPDGAKSALLFAGTVGALRGLHAATQSTAPIKAFERLLVPFQARPASSEPGTVRLILGVLVGRRFSSIADMKKWVEWIGLGPELANVKTFFNPALIESPSGLPRAWFVRALRQVWP